QKKQIHKENDFGANFGPTFWSNPLTLHNKDKRDAGLLRRAFDYMVPHPPIIGNMGLDVAAAFAYVLFEFVLMAIGAAYPETVVGHVKEEALVVRATPGARFAGGRAAVFLPNAVRPTIYRVKLFEVEFLAILGTMILNLVPNVLSVAFGIVDEYLLGFLEARGVEELVFYCFSNMVFFSLYWILVWLLLIMGNL
ncbi:MAG: hypothetical protein IJ787_00725, partial [Bacilli bacterium]|nr:hypothetical protein [Bacilli bacterium]